MKLSGQTGLGKVPHLFTHCRQLELSHMAQRVTEDSRAFSRCHCMPSKKGRVGLVDTWRSPSYMQQVRSRLCPTDGAGGQQPLGPGRWELLTVVVGDFYPIS